MHRSEVQDFVSCSQCGADSSFGADRVYAITEETALCFACAVKRGGSYDEARDQWTRPPDLRGIELR